MKKDLKDIVDMLNSLEEHNVEPEKVDDIMAARDRIGQVFNNIIRDYDLHIAANAVVQFLAALSCGERDEMKDGMFRMLHIISEAYNNNVPLEVVAMEDAPDTVH